MKAMTEEDIAVQALFVDYITKARKIYGAVNKHHTETDSDIAVLTYSLMTEFDKYRSQPDERPKESG